MQALSRVWMVGFGVSAFWILIIRLIHWNSPRTLVSFHGLLHAAIAGKFLGTSNAAFPPENPFYAGEPVAYYWFFQYLAAQVSRILGLNIFYSLEGLILISTGVLMTVAVFLGRRLYGSLLTGVLMGYLIVAGTNPLGWLFAVYQYIRKGPGIIADNPDHLWGVVHPVYSLIRYNDFGGIYGPLLNFFLNITSRPAALAGLLVAITYLNKSVVGRRRISYVALGIAFAITTALSPIIGILTGGTFVMVLAALWIWDRRSYHGESDDVSTRMRSTLFAGFAIIAGVLLALPTYYHLLLGPSANHVRFWLFSGEGVRHVITVVLSIFLLVALAMWGYIRTSQIHKRFLLILIASALFLLAVEASVTLPDGNGSNLFHVAVLLLTVPASGSIMGRYSTCAMPLVRKRFALGVFIVFLPTALLLLATYINRPALPVSFEEKNLTRLPNDSGLGLLYKWAQNETDPNAIFIVDPKERVQVCGNSLEFPAMTNRVIFTENLNHYIAAPYPNSKARFELARLLTSGEQANAEDSKYLERFNRPIYVLSYRADDALLNARMEKNYGRPGFQNGSLAVYRWTNKPVS